MGWHITVAQWSYATFVGMTCFSSRWTFCLVTIFWRKSRHFKVIQGVLFLKWWLYCFLFSSWKPHSPNEYYEPNYVGCGSGVHPLQSFWHVLICSPAFFNQILRQYFSESLKHQPLDPNILSHVCLTCMMFRNGGENLCLRVERERYVSILSFKHMKKKKLILSQCRFFAEMYMERSVA